MEQALIWVPVGRVEDIPARGARVVRTARGDVAVFRTGTGDIFALYDRCPHRGGPLSQGLVHGNRVACPLHNWLIDLATGEVVGPDQGCTPVVPVQVVEGEVRLGLALVAEPAHG